MTQTYLTAAQAVARLGVKPATLYAYVSRGLVHTTQLPSPGRGSLYAAADVERLFARSQARRGHGAAAAGAMRWGEPVLDSAITALTPSSIAYRGIAVNELLSEPFEAVCELLWTEILPQRLAPWPAPRRGALGGERAHAQWLGDRRGKSVDAMAAQDRESRLMAYGIAAYALAQEAHEFDEQLDQTLGRARGVIGFLAGKSTQALKGRRSLQAPMTVAEALLNLLTDGRRPVTEAAQRIAACNVALILSADHELNSSSFAARIAASTGADLYACLLAGCGTLSGPLHGGALGRFEALIAALPSGARFDAGVGALLKSPKGLTGFGHPLYPNGDPRTPPLLARAEELDARSVEPSTVRKILQFIHIVRDATGAEPSVDVGLVAIASALKLRPGAAFSLFAVGRTAGWTAHIIEQRQQKTPLRPRARYVGR